MQLHDAYVSVAEVYRIAFFPVGSKIRSFRSLTAQNEYFSARPARVHRGVVHVRTQEMKIKLTKIHIFAQNENVNKTLYGTQTNLNTLSSAVCRSVCVCVERGYG